MILQATDAVYDNKKKKKNVSLLGEKNYIKCKNTKPPSMTAAFEENPTLTPVNSATF